MPTMPHATAQSRNDHTIRDLTDVDQLRRAGGIAPKGTNRFLNTGTRPVAATGCSRQPGPLRALATACHPEVSRGRLAKVG